MTRRGIVLVIALALLLLIGLGTGMREIYFAVFCILLILLYSLISALQGALNLRCGQTLERAQAVRGEQTGLRIGLDGRLVLPVVLRLHVRLPDFDAALSDQLFQFTFLPGSRRPALTLRLSCPHRGMWPVGMDKVRVYDIFGLFAFSLLKKGAANLTEQTLTVYPQLYEVGESVSSPAILADETSSHTVVTDHGDSFAGTRPYRDGDSLKRIHWIQTVRTRELHTRQYEMSTQQYHLLLVDTGVPAGADLPSYADMSGECAGTLALRYLQEGRQVQLRSVGAFEAAVTANGEDDFFELYTLLAEMPYAPAAGALDLSAFPGANLGAIRSIHVITHRPSRELLETLRILAGRRCFVSCVVPDFSFARQLALSCPEEVRLRLIARPADILTEWEDSL